MKPKPDKPKEIDWKQDDASAKLQVGETFTCKFHRHGSVGEDAEFDIEDTSIISHEDTETEYTHPEHMKKPGWTGGDAERGLWVFKALKKGRTKLTVRVLFRFDVESEHFVDIEVH
ncbi:MAG: hypothetical protein ACTSU3_00015 [Candidatus Thorarchaeota archaeon]